MNPYLLLALTIIFWGTAPIIEKHGLASINPVLAVFIRSIAVIIGISSIVFVSGAYRELPGVPGRSVAAFLLSGIIAGVLGMITYFSILKTGRASRIVPLSASYPLFTALLGVFVLKEKFSFYTLAGTVLICAGIVLIELAQ